MACQDRIRVDPKVLVGKPVVVASTNPRHIPRCCAGGVLAGRGDMTSEFTVVTDNRLIRMRPLMAGP